MVNGYFLTYSIKSLIIIWEYKIGKVLFMKITMLGTGNAMVTECYNTCFVLHEDGKYFLVDGGGGNTLFRQLKYANINWSDIREVFVTHSHVDHLMGIIWLVRKVCQSISEGKYEGEINVYAHNELCDMIIDFSKKLYPEKVCKFIGSRFHLIPIEDGEEREIIGHRVKFFDIGSTKLKQFGFTIGLEDGKHLTCCGDEPFRECERTYAQNSKWLLHEAFCLYAEADTFHPYEKHHSTAKDSAKLASELCVENLLLYHTEDKNILCRKELYTAEAKKYFSGNVFVPDDLETIEL